MSVFWGRVQDRSAKDQAPSVLTRVSDAVTGRSYERIEAGQQQAIELMTAVRQHIESQAERSERMAASLSQLAYAMSSVPEANRLNADTLRTLINHVATGNVKAAALSDLLVQLQQQSQGQGQVIQALADALRTNESVSRQRDEQLTHTLGKFEQTLGAVGLNARCQTDMLSRLAEMEQKQDARLLDLIRKQNRRFNSLFVVSLVLAGMAILAALITVGTALSR